MVQWYSPCPGTWRRLQIKKGSEFKPIGVAGETPAGPLKHDLGMACRVGCTK